MILGNKGNFLKVNKAWKVFIIILMVNIVQSVFSQLLNDEPYYWLYAQYPSWGYFDHPPMIAFLIRAGTFLLPGEIGVRLFSTILGSLTFFLIYCIIEKETVKSVNFKLLVLLLFSSVFLNLYSFLAIPDTPLLFFAALFLYTYRKYLQNDSIVNSLCLGVVAALLLYSKYHGVLLIGFTVLSNIKLLKKPSFYIVLVTTILLFAPHIYWQAQNDYPTIRFQLFERTNNFRIDHVFSYLGEQAGVTGPVILLLFSILYKPVNQFQKTLKYHVAGVFIFFFISSFREMVNVHWTGIAWPAMICLAYFYIDGLKGEKKYIRWVLAFNLTVVTLFRLNFIFNFLPISNFNDKNPRLMSAVLTERSGLPLVFKDMYNEPSDIMFYQHRHSFAANNVWYKKTQFNYLPSLEKEFQGENVNLVSYDPIDSTSKEVIIPKGKKYYLTDMPQYASFGSIKINAPGLKYLNATALNKITLSVSGKLTKKGPALFAQKKGYLLLYMVNAKTNKSYSFRYDQVPDLSGKAPFQFEFKAPDEKGAYNCIFSLMTNDGFLTQFNSNTYKIELR